MSTGPADPVRTPDPDDGSGPTAAAPAGWHPDPAARHEHRYWDGSTWTDHVADAGVQSSDPLG